MKIFKKCIPSACESVYREILCLIVRPWDCPQNREAWEVCSWKGEGCPILWQIYAWHCIVIVIVIVRKILYKSIRTKNKKYNEKLNKAMHKFLGVLDKYGWRVGWGGGGVYLPSLNFKYGHFPFWGVGHVPLPSWYLPMLQFHLALCCFFKAMLLKNV